VAVVGGSRQVADSPARAGGLIRAIHGGACGAAVIAIGAHTGAACSGLAVVAAEHVKLALGARAAINGLAAAPRSSLEVATNACGACIAGVRYAAYAGSKVG
jgi:hypothetical protein